MKIGWFFKNMCYNENKESLMVKFLSNGENIDNWLTYKRYMFAVSWGFVKDTNKKCDSCLA